MERPIVNFIEPQRVESEREVTGSEAEELLRKYGYTQEFSSIKPTEPQPVIKRPEDELSFEEMCARDEAKRKAELERKRQQQGPQPKTFDNVNGYDSQVKYGSDDELGFGFKIEIISDMKLPKY